MKLRGKIEGQEVVVLIDCGASHNFISTDLVSKLGIPSVGALESSWAQGYPFV